MRPCCGAACYTSMLRSVSISFIALMTFTLMLWTLFDGQASSLDEADAEPAVEAPPRHLPLRNISCYSRVTLRYSPEELVARMRHDDLLQERYQHWAFIVDRVTSSYPAWSRAAEQLFAGYAKILLVPGIMLATDMAEQERVRHGSPTGDLVQWADLAAALWVMGHNVSLTKDIYAVQRGLMYGHYQWSRAQYCPKHDFDLIYMDIITYNAIMKYVPHECKVRILDAYGTHSMYNNPQYVRANKPLYDSQYGSLSLELAHTPDNSFLGFAVEKLSPDSDFEKENIALLYGKDVTYFKNHIAYIEEISKLYEIHTTLTNSSLLSKYVINHGVISQKRYAKLLAKSKLLIGFGLPLESSAVIEAISRGVQFLNPKYSLNETNILQKLGKPTSRKITSQLSFLEENVLAPYSYTLDITNITEVRVILKDLQTIKSKNYVPREFTHMGFINRLSYYLSEQNFCMDHEAMLLKKRDWSSINLFIGELDQSCELVCKLKGKICDRNYFEHIYSDELLFTSLKINCTTVDSGSEPIYPAFDGDTQQCALLTDRLLYSCAGQHKQWTRICPCRSYTYFDRFI